VLEFFIYFLAVLAQAWVAEKQLAAADLFPGFGIAAIAPQRHANSRGLTSRFPELRRQLLQ